MKKEETPFERKSTFNHKRTSYLDASFNYVYEYDEKRIVVPYCDEYKEVFMALDTSDHFIDLQERNEADHRSNEPTGDSEGNGKMNNVIDEIPDNNSYENSLYDNSNAGNTLITELERFICYLPESQKELIYMHFGMRMTFEEIAAYESENEKSISRQAIYNRFLKIKRKIIKEFGHYFPD